MSKSIAYKHYSRALSKWPKDNLRPECQFQDAMRRRIDRRFLPAPSPEPLATAQAVAISPVDEKYELEQANAIYALLDNRFLRKYPIKGSLMKPTRNPTYYTDLVRELEEAPNRGFWARFTKKWKGMVRFS